jgi:putative spermidine/putrescine transport system substrate-binding protein
MTNQKLLLASAGVTCLLLAPMAQAQSMAEIEAAAKAEGMLSTIALPHDWCGYGDIIASFKAKYPEITVNELNPDAGSADEIEAVKANKDNKGPQAPDVLDVGLAFGPSAQAEGLLQPYKVAVWDSIPEGIKDADGHWYGAYYGVMGFAVNKDLVENVPRRTRRSLPFWRRACRPVPHRAKRPGRPVWNSSSN